LDAAPFAAGRIKSLSCLNSYLALQDTLRYPLIIKGDAEVPETIEIQLKKGVLTLCVLALLNRRDSYAYEIASTLADAIDMGEGTIYPLMRRMQSDGQVETYLVESTSGPSRKYYRLTDAGRRALEAQTAEWRAFVTAVEDVMNADAEPAPPDAVVANTEERGAEQ
jgi:PadR family transcriptional regulator PadR